VRALMPEQVGAAVGRAVADRLLEQAIGARVLFHLALVAVGDALGGAAAAALLRLHRAARHVPDFALVGPWAGTHAALLGAHLVDALVALLLRRPLRIGVVERRVGRGLALGVLVPLFVGTVIGLIVHFAALIRVHVLSFPKLD